MFLLCPVWSKYLRNLFDLFTQQSFPKWIRQRTFQQTSCKKCFPQVGANSFSLACSNLQCWLARKTHLLCILHKPWGLAFTRSSHRYFGPNSIQEFFPWSPFSGPVISCILHKLQSWRSIPLEWANSIEPAYNFSLGFLPMAWESCCILGALIARSKIGTRFFRTCYWPIETRLTEDTYHPNGATFNCVKPFGHTEMNEFSLSFKLSCSFNPPPHPAPHISG